MTQLAIGKPAPLGAHYDGQGVNFTLFSVHAERVELCVFDANGQNIAMTCQAQWRHLARLSAGCAPGFALWLSRSWPPQPAEGHRFNPAKLLIDPARGKLTGSLKITRCCTPVIMNLTIATTPPLRRNA